MPSVSLLRLRSSILVLWVVALPAVAFLPLPRCTVCGSRRFTIKSSVDDDKDTTLETLSDLLSGLWSSKESTEKQRELLTTRLASISISRTFVQESTLPSAGLGLFASQDCPPGTLLTCYPGDALVDLNQNDDNPIQWGSHTKNMTTTNNHTALCQEYMLRAVVDHWGIVAIPKLTDNPSYRGHLANDGIEDPPTCEQDLAPYVLESTSRANAEHRPCQDCHMVTVATKFIKRGEEIFVTYGPEYWREQDSFVGDGTTDTDSDSVFFEDELEEEFDFDENGDDYYEDEAEAILADIISSSEETSSSPTRGKGFG